MREWIGCYRDPGRKMQAGRARPVVEGERGPMSKLPKGQTSVGTIIPSAKSAKRGGLAILTLPHQ